MKYCFFCRNACPQASKDATAVLCSHCVQKLVGPPDLKPPAEKLSAEEKAERKAAKEAKKAEKLEKMKTAVRGRGRGWHLKRLFEFDGKYYSMGKEISSVEAMKIRKELAKEIPDLNAPAPKTRGRKTVAKKVSRKRS